MAEIAKVFPAQWFNRPVGVVFDFGPGKDLFYLYPGRQAPDGRKILVELAVGRYFKKDDFIKVVKEHPERFTKTPMKMREDYQWELDKPKREAAERKRKIMIGQQIFLSLAKPVIEKAQEQLRLTGKSIALPVGQTGYMVDAYRHAHKIIGDRLHLNWAPDDSDYIRWANEFEVLQVS